MCFVDVTGVEGHEARLGATLGIGEVLPNQRRRRRYRASNIDKQIIHQATRCSTVGQNSSAEGECMSLHLSHAFKLC
jgi:hypothetical protein